MAGGPKRSSRNARFRQRAPILIAVTRAGPGRVTAAVTGDIDLATASHLETTLRDTIAGYRPRSLTVDIGGVAFLDAAGLTAFIRTYAYAAQVDISLTNAQPMVVRVLAITGLLEALRVSAKAG
jgi:anti-anti-sigma factor